MSEAYEILSKFYDDVLADIDIPVAGSLSKSIDDINNDSTKITPESLATIKAQVNKTLKPTLQKTKYIKANFKSAQMDFKETC